MLGHGSSRSMAFLNECHREWSHKLIGLERLSPMVLAFFFGLCSGTYVSQGKSVCVHFMQ